jgi:DNA-binding NarL/FixJ family response regulator
VDTAAQLQRGRRSFRRQAWDDAHGSLTAADGAEPLGGADLELLATSAFMLGREDEYLRVLERAYGAHAAGDAPLAATRCAFWVGAHRAQRGDMGQAGGWLARARRMLERAGPDHVERGYLLLPVVFAQRAAGDWEAAAATAGEAVALAERFGDQDLLALAAHEQGHTLVDNGRLDEGLALLDEAMVAAAAGELSPIVAGIVYCGAILACQDAYELGRAQEWTVALTRWWDRQPALVAFTGRCLVHRAEILQLHGDWPAAMEEAARAVERCQGGGNAAGAGEAWYRQGEIHRLRGELAAAERAYREAHGRGRDPEPGRALLRLAQGRRAAATGAIRRALGDLSGTARIGVLCAAVEVFVATGETAEARAACDELEEICGVQGTPALDAMRARARGTVALAEGEAAAALATLRRGRELWLELGAPYEAARVRSLAGVACRALGDEEGAALEIAAAEETFRRLAADPDIGLADPLRRGPAGDGELTERQLEVLRLVADGATNREIAARLVISEHTVARHLQNVFARLGVSSRTGAIARARDHDLL